MKNNHIVVAAILASCQFSNAQDIIVDPLGGGHFKDLQAAINAAASGNVIEVRGGNYGNIVISKSLTIIGNPAPEIAPPEKRPSGGAPQPPAIDLVGTGSQRMLLCNIRTVGKVHLGGPGAWSLPGSGIRSKGFAEMRVLNCIVRTPELTMKENHGQPLVPAIEVKDGGSLVVSRCTISTNAGFNRVPTYQPVTSEPAIRSAGPVLVLDSEVRGGPGVPVYLERSTKPAVPRCPWGCGAVPVEAKSIFALNSKMLGGKGADIMWRSSSSVPQWTKIGVAADGKGFAGVTVGDDLTASPLRIGTNWYLRFPDPRRRPAILAFGELRVPTQLPSLNGWLFLDLSKGLAFVGLPPSTSSLGIAVPNKPQLVGLSVLAQFVTSKGYLSRPVLDVVKR